MNLRMLPSKRGFSYIGLTCRTEKAITLTTLMTKYDLSDVRQERIPQLEQMGFKVAPSLPWIHEFELKPIEMIARRFLAVRQLAMWVCMSEEQVGSEGIISWGNENDVFTTLAPEERSILDLDRSEASTHAGNIGWKFEGAYALSWILGSPEAELGTDGGMVQQDKIAHMFFEFAPNFEQSLPDWVSQQTPKGEQDVVLMEDLHYCLLNAGRSARHGDPSSVPDSWDPMASTGVIQERRQGLTWALTPDCSWEDTDLSS